MYSRVKAGVMGDMSSLDWLPLACVIVYMVAAPLGLCSIPFMYIAELYPAEMRSLLGKYKEDSKISVLNIKNHEIYQNIYLNLLL